ncbi:MAG: DUF2007 domain-containing protein [Bacteroidetes bacterium]|nr:DUF2007 domain-containing protein [Bacteroidota bacterium]MBK9671568.1 DUF2007 domain-containing protein [Bacteroidota bacterium]MBK9799492.1 DUF2007 domain-containing protein [Bacteroidota bacterium]
MDENWVKVYSSRSLASAEIIKSMLLENDLDAVLLNKLDSSYLAFGQAEVYVNSMHEEVAKKLIEQDFQANE